MNASDALRTTGSWARGLTKSSRASDEPSARLFSRIRWRLTLWYSAIVAAALVLSGVVLYLGIQQSLLGPVNTSLKSYAGPAATQWQENLTVAAGAPYPLAVSCPVEHQPVLVACYNPHGDLLYYPDTFNPTLKVPATNGGTATFLKAFLNPSLAKSAVGSRSAIDTIQTSGAGELSALQRYAKTVTLPGSKRVMGIIQVGSPVGDQASTLKKLLHLLLILGACTILVSFFLGLFLANRALLPARLAYARQRDFIADASHELRTPLTMLRTTVEVVLRGNNQLPAEDVALLEDSVAETTHLTAMANNLLSLARLDSDTVRVEEDVVDLAQLGAEVSRWALHLAAERGIAISSSPSESVLVIGDRALLEQAILVLVDNAIKYNEPGGSVEVATTTVGAQASLSVTDTGIGIAPEHIQRLGERFYRVDKARSRESGGAGLGLSIARSVAARHGGSLTIKSEPGHGTTVTLVFPLARGALPTEPNSTPVSPARFMTTRRQGLRTHTVGYLNTQSDLTRFPFHYSVAEVA